MDPPATSSNPQTTTPDLSKDLKESTEQISEVHQRTPQDSSKEADKEPSRAYKLGAETDKRTELQKYDQQAKIWVYLHICWLAWNVFSALPNFGTDVLQPLFSFNIGRLLPNLISSLIKTCPYWIQLWGIYKRSLKATNRAIKILGVCVFFVAIAVAFCAFCYFYADNFYALFTLSVQLLKEKVPDHPALQQMQSLPPVESLREAYWSMLGSIGEVFAYFVAGYFAARRYRSYLNQRQKILKKNE